MLVPCCEIVEALIEDPIGPEKSALLQESRSNPRWQFVRTLRRFRGPIPLLLTRFLLVHRWDSKTRRDSRQDR